MTKYELEDLNTILDEGKTILIALENGGNNEKENCGVCGCGQPAYILVYAWR